VPSRMATLMSRSSIIASSPPVFAALTADAIASAVSTDRHPHRTVDYATFLYDRKV
jgi:hypothetical protein